MTVRSHPLAWVLVAGVLSACGASAGLASTGTTPSATSRSSPGKVSCGPASAKTLTADRRGRVFVLGPTVYACSKAKHKRYSLGRHNTCFRPGRAAPVALAGRALAYGLELCAVDTGSSTVLVRSLATGKRLHSYTALKGPVGVESYIRVGSIVVNALGKVAWIAVGTSLIHHGPAVIEVHDGASVVASGSGIDPESLAPHGSQISWTQDGTTRTATL